PGGRSAEHKRGDRHAKRSGVENMLLAIRDQIFRRNRKHRCPDEKRKACGEPCERWRGDDERKDEAGDGGRLNICWYREKPRKEIVGKTGNEYKEQRGG